jgi:formylmethanofuran dehydrogenase subunit C
MASIVTAQLEPSGLPKEAGYTTGFAVMAGCMVVAALAGALIPSSRRAGPTTGDQVPVELVPAEALAMTGDALMGEAAAGETVQTERGE